MIHIYIRNFKQKSTCKQMDYKIFSYRKRALLVSKAISVKIAYVLTFGNIIYSSTTFYYSSITILFEDTAAAISSESLVECYENGNDFFTVAYDLSITRPTAYSIVRLNTSSSTCNLSREVLEI